MREILFRGKAINRNKGYHRTKYKNGDWVHGLLTRWYDELFENLPAEMTNTDGVSGIEIDYKTIGQYTGLTDKNGTKIFEGDILRLLDCNNLPRWHNVGDCVVVNFDEDYCGFNPFCTYDCDCGEYVLSVYTEVIGNIHDNPELLKEGYTERGCER